MTVYVPFQVLTAEELNASFAEKTDNADAKISGGYADGLDHVTITGPIDAVSPTSGALIVTGGVGIGKALNVATTLTVGKEARVLSSLASASPTTGALTVVGGVGIGGSVNVGGALTVVGAYNGLTATLTGPNQSTSTSTGALVVVGGVGIGKDAWIGGNIHCQGALVVVGGTTLQGPLSVASLTIQAGGNITFGDGTTQSTKPIDDAPNDANKYGRKANAWTVLTDIAEAPSDGVKYARRNAAWVTLVDTPDAPNDAFWYGRHQAAWAKVTEEAPIDAFLYGRGNGLWKKAVEEAPSDGKQYTRRNAAWNEVSASGLVIGSVPPTDTARYPMWWDNVSGTLYVWYDDGNSAQWVICVPTDAIGAAATTATWGGIIGTLADQLDLQAALDLKLADAPNDANIYGRMGGAWTVVPSGGGGGGGGWVQSGAAPNIISTLTAPAGGGGQATAIIQSDGTGSGPWPRLNFQQQGIIRGYMLASHQSRVSIGSGTSQEIFGGDASQINVTSAIVLNNSLGSHETRVYSSGNSAKLTVGSGGSTTGAFTSKIVGIRGNFGTVGYRWSIDFPTATAEAAGNVGSDFAISRHDNNGIVIDSPLAINRATGITTLLNTVKFTASAAADPAIEVRGNTAGGGSTGSANITLFKTGTGNAAIYGMGGTTAAPVARWGMKLGNAAAESGSNVGSDFTIDRFTDAGAFVDSPFTVNRASGYVTIPRALQASYVFANVVNNEVDIYSGTAPWAWPTLDGGLIALRSRGSAAVGAGMIACYTGSGNTGVALMDGGTAWTVLSDERLKNIDSDITAGLDAIMAIRPVKFRYKTEAADAPIRVGLSAQSVQVGIPEAISEHPIMGQDGNMTEESYLDLKTTEVIPHMVAAIKELNARLKAVEAK